MTEPLKPQFLRVRNWEKFQHYKNRRPPWIKLHVETLDDYELMHLDNDAQLVYERLLLLAARTDNNISHDPDWIGGQIVQDPRIVQAAVETLINTGFLSVAGRKRSASKAIATRKQSADSEAEQKAETEEEPEAEQTPGLPDESLDELGQRLAANAAPFGSEARLFEVLGDMDKNSAKVLRPLLEKLPAAAIEQCRAEVLAGRDVRKRTGYAVEILTSMIEKRRTA